MHGAAVGDPICHRLVAVLTPLLPRRVRPAALPPSFVTVFTGDTVLANGRVVCWGATTWRHMSEGDVVRDLCVNRPESPTPNKSCKRRATRARRRSSAVTCWGINANGILGTRTADIARLEIASLQDAVQLEAGEDHVCARRRTRTLSCGGR